jgi:Family of unknown function (DUF6493)
MTISALDQIVMAADTESCAVFFDTMPERHRKALANRALQWASAVNGFICRDLRPAYLSFDKAVAKDIELYRRIQSNEVIFPAQFARASLPAAKMAVLATCGLRELKTAGQLGLPEPRLAARILKSRQPTWLSTWCAYVLKEAPATHWMALHELESSGACMIERTAGYWTSMFCTLSNRQDMYQILTRDEKLRTELWEMLHDAGVIRMLADPEQIAREIFRKRWNSGGNVFAPRQSGTRKGTEVWREALVKLASEGMIDHARLVEYSFMALSRVAESESKKGYYYRGASTADFAIKLNQSLTGENNTASYQRQFASLLGANHKDVSTYAATVLAAMPAGTLNTAEVCSCIAPAFLNKSKEPADAALKLLDRLAREASNRLEFGRAILSALGHSSKDIHKKTLALIESARLLENKTLLSEFRQRMDMLSGMERAKAEKLASQYRWENEELDTVPAPMQITDLDNLYARASFLDDRLRALALIDDAIESVRKGVCLDEPVLLDNLEFPRLKPDAAVKPITDLDDLIYLFTKVWSGKRDEAELEAVLDGVSRLCHERPFDFNQKTETLRQNVRKYFEESPRGADGLVQIAACWLGEPSGHAAPKLTDRSGSFLNLRCVGVAMRAASRQPAPLLAAPTHAGGWIDPEVLVTRLVECIRLRTEPSRADFIQALLRMAPDNRAAALRAAASIPGEAGDALRYALGGGDIGRIQTPEYWVAALRARDPTGTSEELLKLLPHCGPDGAEAATYDFDMEPISYFANERYASISGGMPNFLPARSADPKFPGPERRGLQTSNDHLILLVNRTKYALFPTVLLHDNSYLAHSIGAYSWLHNRESLLALYAKRVLINIDSIGSYWHGDFEWLFDPDLSMARHGRYFFCFAMSSKNNNLSRLAVDALIAAVRDRRIGATAYGQAMAAVLPSGVITVVRWTRGLRDMSRTSPLHAQFVWQAIGALIGNAAITPTQRIPFLELLVELQFEHRFMPDDALVQVLSGIKGEGKSVKLVNSILAFTASDRSAFQAALLDLESRIGRVERWQNWMNAGIALRQDNRTPTAASA